MNRKIELHPLSLLVGFTVAALAAFTVSAMSPATSAIQVPSVMEIQLVLSERVGTTHNKLANFDLDD